MALLALAGCTPDAASPTVKPSGSPATSASPSASAGASDAPSDDVTDTPTPTPTPTPKPEGMAVSLDCDQVLTPDDMYAFNPNFGMAPDYKPAGGSAAETAAKYDGVACGWSNQTSGEVIAVSVAQPNDVLMTQLKDAAIAQSTPVPTYGTPPSLEGFFTNAGGQGEAQLFTGKYWVALNSSAFFEPGDAQSLAATVVSHLP